MKNLLLPSSPSSPAVLSGACPVLSRPLSRLRAGSGLVALSLAMLIASLRVAYRGPRAAPLQRGVASS